MFEILSIIHYSCSIYDMIFIHMNRNIFFESLNLFFENFYFWVVGDRRDFLISASLVKYINCLIRKCSTVDVAYSKDHNIVDKILVNMYAMMFLVFFTNTIKNFNSFFFCWFRHFNPLKSTF